MDTRYYDVFAKYTDDEILDCLNEIRCNPTNSANTIKQEEDKLLGFIAYRKTEQEKEKVVDTQFEAEKETKLNEEEEIGLGLSAMYISEHKMHLEDGNNASLDQLKLAQSEQLKEEKTLQGEHLKNNTLVQSEQIKETTALQGEQLSDYISRQSEHLDNNQSVQSEQIKETITLQGEQYIKSQTKRRLRFFILKQLNIADFLTTELLPFKWHCLYIIHFIIQQSILNKFEKEYTNINYKTLIRIISKRKYKKIISVLESNSIILCDNKANNYYGKSLGYKINEEKFNITEYEKVACEDKEIVRRIHIYYEKLKDKTKVNMLDKQLAYTTSANNANSLVLQYKEASAFVKQNTNYNIYQRIQRKETIEGFNTKKTFTVDSYGRLHTKLSRLASDMRPFIIGKKLISLDIKNSHPVFMYLLLQEQTGINNEELNQYKFNVETGTFYEMFDYDRDTVKVDFQKYINDGKGYKITKFITRFKYHFPSLHNVIGQIKKTKKTKELATTLQRIEADFVFGIVEVFISHFKEHIPFITTIHDSFVVEEESVELIKSLVNEKFAELGITGTIKQSNFN